MALRPWLSASQFSSRLNPRGETIPIPVIATRLGGMKIGEPRPKIAEAPAITDLAHVERSAPSWVSSAMTDTF